MSAAPAPSRIDPARFRTVTRHLPTGVAAIRSTDPETHTPCDLVVGGSASLSPEPAQVTVSVARTSTSWAKVARSGWFGVSLLADGQQSVYTALAGDEPDRFRALDWELSSYGNPVIRGALGRLDCEVRVERDGGDHVLVITDVHDTAAADGLDPLVLPDGRLGRPRESARPEGYPAPHEGGPSPTGPAHPAHTPEDLA